MRGRHLSSSPELVVRPDPHLLLETGLPPILAIRWIDSGMAIDRGWARREHYLSETRIGAMVAHTAGYLMHEDDDVIVLSSTYDPTGQTFYGAQVIAKTAIVERRALG